MQNQENVTPKKKRKPVFVAEYMREESKDGANAGN